MRYELSDNEWTAIKPMLPNKPRGVRRVNDRRVLNGIFWVLRSGAPWRDLPETYGPRTTCYNRFVRWRRAGVWDQIMDALASCSGPAKAPGSHPPFQRAPDTEITERTSIEDASSARRTPASVRTPENRVRHFQDDYNWINIMTREHICPWTRRRRPVVPFSGLVRFLHDRSSADFTMSTAGHSFR